MENGDNELLEILVAPWRTLMCSTLYGDVGCVLGVMLYEDLIQTPCFECDRSQGGLSHQGCFVYK